MKMRIRDYILFSVTMLTLTGCTSEDINGLPVEERLPLKLEATFSSGKPVTRAIDNKFEENDEILSYVQHVYGSENNVVQKKLVSFTKGDKAMEATDDEAVKKTSDLSAGEALYWDDFSDSSSEDKDLRTNGHGLRSFYGYCYNGRKPSPTLDQDKGSIDWTIDNDQSTAEKMKVNDLLWSATTSSVPYDHASKSTDEHGTLNIPFTHAMSKFTIVIKAVDGYEAGDLASTKVTLKNMTKTGTFAAPSATVSDPTDLVDVIMCPDESTTATTRTYEAVTVPLTELIKDEILAVIENADGNKYEIKVTEGILGTSISVLDDNWSGGLKDGKTQSGYNYKLTVTLNKKAVDVKATLADWNDVNADGTGIINFSADVTDSGVTGDSFNENDAFSLWRTTDLTSFSDEPTTTVKYVGSAFKYTPVLYWENAYTNYYFRALAEMTSGNAITSVSSKEVSQGTALLWATTKEHTVTNSESTEVTYKKGDPINPRTGDVPLVFEHAMSKVVINLESVTGDAAVTLTDATFELTSLSKSGTIDIADGSIKPSTTLDKGFDGASSGATSIMIPQNITDNVKLTVTLKDKTKYSLLLNKCSCKVEGVDTPIKKWESGKQYTYTITLAKEDVKFRVLVKDWTPTSGSGNATLDWD